MRTLEGIDTIIARFIINIPRMLEDMRTLEGIDTSAGPRGSQGPNVRRYENP